MVTKEAFKNGILSYMDSEVIPHLPTAGKWGLGAFVVLASTKFDNLFEILSNNKLCKELGIIDNDNMIDVDLLAIALEESAEKYGKMTFSLPVIGTLTFSKDDIFKIRDHICDYGGQ